MSPGSTFRPASMGTFSPPGPSPCCPAGTGLWASKSTIEAWKGSITTSTAATAAGEHCWQRRRPARRTAGDACACTCSVRRMRRGPLHQSNGGPGDALCLVQGRTWVFSCTTELPMNNIHMLTPGTALGGCYQIADRSIQTCLDDNTGLLRCESCCTSCRCSSCCCRCAI